jgi:eukaryotic-like serine/threonine-protein kinase
MLSPPKRPPDEFIGKVLAERYLVEALLGEGGMGSVYRARHVHMQKQVAIKVLHRELTLNDEIRLRFEREAIASGRIDHPHVTGATDFGKLDDGTCYLVLDFVSGESLKEVLAALERLGPGRAVHIVRQIASALDAAHTAGVVHRDLKPENVMLIEHKGEVDFVKVLDFGIAKIESRNSGHTVQLTQAGAVFGTPEYMSPEQAAGNAVDGRADLYTIGIMLYEMLAGETPFHGETIVAILTQHLTADPPELPSDVPPQIRRIVKKLLQKDPELRFQTAAELLEALDSVEEPQTAPTLRAPALSPLPSARAEVGASDRPKKLWPLVRHLGLLPVNIGRKPIALWRMALACSLIGVLVTSLFWQNPPESVESRDSTPTPRAEEAPPHPTPKTQAPPARVDLGRARNGESASLGALEALPAKERTAAEWAALVVGLFRAGKPKNSLAALDAALENQHAVVGESDVLAAAAALALDPATSEPALLRLSEHFGERGADLLYAWSRKAPAGVDPTFAERVAKALRDASKNATPALLVALELDEAHTCGAVRELLPRAQTEGDARATAGLQKKTARRGCGLFDLQDCFKCLRGNDALNDTIEATKSRPAPVLAVPLEAQKSAANLPSSTVP